MPLPSVSRDSETIEAAQMKMASSGFIKRSSDPTIAFAKPKLSSSATLGGVKFAIKMEPEPIQDTEFSDVEEPSSPSSSSLATLRSTLYMKLAEESERLLGIKVSALQLENSLPFGSQLNDVETKELQKTAEYLIEFWERQMNKLNIFNNLVDSHIKNDKLCSTLMVKPILGAWGTDGTSQEPANVSGKLSQKRVLEIQDSVKRKYFEDKGLQDQLEDAYKKRRKNIPHSALLVLQDWFDRHDQHPYPSYKEKVEIAAMAGISQSQVANWFINVRKRRWLKRGGESGGSSTAASSSSTVLGDLQTTNRFVDPAGAGSYSAEHMLDSDFNHISLPFSRW